MAENTNIINNFLRKQRSLLQEQLADQTVDIESEGISPFKNKKFNSQKTSFVLKSCESVTALPCKYH